MSLPGITTPAVPSYSGLQAIRNRPVVGAWKTGPSRPPSTGVKLYAEHSATYVSGAYAPPQDITRQIVK